MPYAESPVVAGVRFLGNLQPRRILYDKDLVGMIVGFGSHVRVVVVRHVLEAEEKHHVAVPVFLAGLQAVGFDDTVAEHLAADQRDVEGRAIQRLVLALLRQFQRAFAVDGGNGPRAGIGHDEILDRLGLRKILGVQQLIILRNLRRLLFAASHCGNPGGNAQGSHREHARPKTTPHD